MCVSIFFRSNKQIGFSSFVGSSEHFREHQIHKQIIEREMKQNLHYFTLFIEDFPTKVGEDVRLLCTLLSWVSIIGEFTILVHVRSSKSHFRGNTADAFIAGKSLRKSHRTAPKTGSLRWLPKDALLHQRFCGIFFVTRSSSRQSQTLNTKP